MELEPANAARAPDEHQITPEAFQQIMLERKAERKRLAEMKRQEGLRRIAEMKSKDGKDPRSLFPTEIWSKILEELSPRDRYNTSRVHPFFHDLMGSPNIENILFSLTLDYGIPLLEMLLSDYSNDRDHEDKEQILALRLVSKDVRDAVDKWIEDDLLSSMKSSTSPRFDPISVDFTDDVAALNRISAFTRGPVDQVRPMKLVFRALQINFPSEQEPRLPVQMRHYIQALAEFKNRITELLSKVGDQVLYFGLSHFYYYPTDIQSAYRIYREWLLLLPSVTWIDLRTSESSLTHLPMPRLNALERVELGDIRIRPTLEAVLAANPQVKHVAYKFNQYFHLDHLGYPYTALVVWPLALESMKLGDPKFYAYSDFNIQWLQQHIFSNVNWRNLKLLRLCVKTASLDKVFRCLQDNFPALETLSLHAFNATVGRQLSCLQLPSLKHLELKFGENMMIFNGDFHFFFSLHFLLHCCNLQSLKWTNLFPIHARWLELGPSEALIDFPGDGLDWNWDAGRSNVWNVFPQLRFIKLKFRQRSTVERIYYDYERSFVRPVVTG